MNNLYLTSDEFGNLTVQSNLDGISDQDFQLWLIDSNDHLIQNKRNEMYLTVDFDETVKLSEYDHENFNKWQLVLSNESLKN